MKKLLCFIATFSLLTNTLLAPISVLAEESPTPEPTETPAAEETITPTDDPLSTPTTSLDIVITNEATPTPTPEETVNEATPTVTSEDIPSQSLESNPTVQGPPDSVSLEPSQTPTMTPEPSNENGTISAVVLENEKIDESVLNDFDLDYTEDGSATISTDKLAYSPTDTAVTSATSFVAGTTYNINITSADGPAGDFEDTLTANEE